MGDEPQGRLAAVLTVTLGPAAGRSLALHEEVVIGRERADLTIDDHELSRRHARVRPAGGAVVVEDLGSTNGTYVDGRRITEPVTVTSNAVLGVGGSEIAIELPLAATRVGPGPVLPPAHQQTQERAVPVAPAPAPPKRKGPPLWHERSVGGKLLFGILGPVMAGIGSAILLGVSGPLFLIATAMGLGAAFMGSLEHTDIGHGALRGGVGGGAFGVALVVAHELIGTEPDVSLPEPLGVFPVFTGLGAMAIGAAASLVRAGRENPARAPGDLSFFELGMVAALVAAPFGAFAQILHPLPDPGDEDPRAFLETIAPSDEWIFVHLLSIVAYVVALPAFGALWRAHRPGRSRWLAGYGFAFMVIATAVGVVWVTIDGIAIKDTADAWANATGGRRLAIEENAIALEEIILGLFSIELIIFFGVPFLLYGLAQLLAREDPSWLAIGLIAAACLNIVSGVAQSFTDRTELVTHIMVPIGAVAISVWIPIAAVMMWRRVSVVGAPEGSADGGPPAVPLVPQPPAPALVDEPERL